ncbi:hypothetical protein E2C01_071312 [Portunus trituberculatus]|uniref:Uncharacterized protein n=1 Tax=Portunus trituberculatus TaxID=210409 RepID=A0A5B7I5W0_PORTR|nr:hypothetical protein [Portunus trituberculatus]
MPSNPNTSRHTNSANHNNKYVTEGATMEYSRTYTPTTQPLFSFKRLLSDATCVRFGNYQVFKQSYQQGGSRGLITLVRKDIPATLSQTPPHLGEQAKDNINNSSSSITSSSTSRPVSQVNRRMSRLASRLGAAHGGIALSRVLYAVANLALILNAVTNLAVSKQSF